MEKDRWKFLLPKKFFSSTVALDSIILMAILSVVFNKPQEAPKVSFLMPGTQVSHAQVNKALQPFASKIHTLEFKGDLVVIRTKTPDDKTFLLDQQEVSIDGYGYRLRSYPPPEKRVLARFVVVGADTEFSPADYGDTLATTKAQLYDVRFERAKQGWMVKRLTFAVALDDVPKIPELLEIQMGDTKVTHKIRRATHDVAFSPDRLEGVRFSPTSTPQTSSKPSLLVLDHPEEKVLSPPVQSSIQVSDPTPTAPEGPIIEATPTAFTSARASYSVVAKGNVSPTTNNFAPLLPEKGKKLAEAPLPAKAAPKQEPTSTPDNGKRNREQVSPQVATPSKKSGAQEAVRGTTSKFVSKPAIAQSAIVRQTPKSAIPTGKASTNRLTDAINQARKVAKSL
jgi:hypothetical protein